MKAACRAEGRSAEGMGRRPSKVGGGRGWVFAQGRGWSVGETQQENGELDIGLTVTGLRGDKFLLTSV